MNTNKISQIEALLGRELREEEKNRLRLIKNTLNISDNDALWDILVAMEYQRSYYEVLPEKIGAATEEIAQKIAKIAEKEVSLAQGRLAESVMTQAETMSLKMHTHSLLAVGIFGTSLLLIYGSLLLWAGYSIGSGKTHPPAWLLHMPVGVVLGAAALVCGLGSGALAARYFSEGNTAWKRYFLIAIFCSSAGGFVFSCLL